MQSEFALFLTAFCLADSLAVAGTELPAELVGRIEKIVEKHYPDAEISQKNGIFIAKHDVMVFTVHSRLKTGEYLEKTDQIEGPNVKGFRFGLAVKEGNYEGPAFLPSTSGGPYWSTYWDYPPTTDGKKMYSIHFAYGDLIDQDFKNALIEVLPKTERREKRSE